MKKIILFFLLLMFFSCGSETPQNVTGVIKKFEPRVQKGASFFPRIEFTDGRFFYLDAMPRSQVDNGSEVIIYTHYISYGWLIYVDSIASKKRTVLADTAKIH